MGTKIIEKDLAYKLTGYCFNVQNDLGRFCKEKQYADKLEEEFKNNKVNYKREYKLSQMNQSIEGNVVDFLIEDKIILDCKAKNFITKQDYFQIQRYLTAANLELGLIVNFRDSHLKPKRVLNSALYSGHSDANSENSDRP